jgi:hypothetical protein
MTTLFLRDAQGQRVEVSRFSFLVGRDTDCDLVLNEARVSRHHARFDFENNTVTLTDLTSANGTFHNGKKLEGTVVLRSGDQVQFANVAFQIEIPSAQAATMVGGFSVDALKAAMEAQNRQNTPKAGFPPISPIPPVPPAGYANPAPVTGAGSGGANPGVVHCSACGRRAEPGGRFCEQCGRPFLAPAGAAGFPPNPAATGSVPASVHGSAPVPFPGHSAPPPPLVPPAPFPFPEPSRAQPGEPAQRPAHGSTSGAKGEPPKPRSYGLLDGITLAMQLNEKAYAGIADSFLWTFPCLFLLAVNTFIYGAFVVPSVQGIPSTVFMAGYLGSFALSTVIITILGKLFTERGPSLLGWMRALSIAQLPFMANVVPVVGWILSMWTMLTGIAAIRGAGGTGWGKAIFLGFLVGGVVMVAYTALVVALMQPGVARSLGF